MKQKSPPVTSATLDQKLKAFDTSFDKRLKSNISALETRMDIKMERMEQRIDDRARGYRDEVLTVIDAIAAQLKTITEEMAAMNAHASMMLDRINNHESRIQKLEHVH